ncbi:MULTISPECIES: DUF4197 domain-containing protein [Ramlibacter]|uniref:DUF4197 family protein n=1 Tax=Ramlibacter pinisoli TaxID=2682844 RepID=A0A6N8J3U5_9BURK|nr:MULTISPECIES: DUF4197 domain-containing protein [Ramlibacter]MBA2962990.1 DUF4197 domain-containing protein [Ramlibacter sp. CGMCC 1.13660]MVQ32933.1 DUF4197 family protein [Ramlibacter pinisoli]
MQRRPFALALALAASPLVLLPPAARAGGLAALSDADASKGIKAALETGALAAVRLLGVQDGFLANPKVHIPLPGALQEAAKLLKAIGRRQQVEDLELALNRAAESAVPLARNLLVDAVRTMSVSDAKGILTGGDTSVTAFFADRTRTPLAAQFLPVVHQATARVDLAAKYDRVAGQAAGFGLVKKEDASIDHYVTRKALDGLYLVIGEEEKKIRSNPVAAGSDILRKVFGAIR